MCIMLIEAGLPYTINDESNCIFFLLLILSRYNIMYVLCSIKCDTSCCSLFINEIKCYLKILVNVSHTSRSHS